jgi:formate-dependent nitrite reductase membrane component NrfD
MILLRKEQENPFAVKKLPILAPIVLSIGMGALFLDLEHKLFVFRFYTTFQPSSPMSWGSWILIVIYPVSVLLVLAYLREGYPWLASYVDRYKAGRWLTDFAQTHKLTVAKWGLIVAVMLGIYTGILLSAFSARPFWNTGFLGPLFLISGLSTAAVLVILGAHEAERCLFTKIDVGIIVVELILISLLLVNLSTGAGAHLDAAGQILGGGFTQTFWLYFILPGLLIPLLLEYWELAGKRSLAFLSPLLIFYGGYMLRHLTLQVGQLTTWTSYTDQFNTELLQLLK